MMTSVFQNDNIEMFFRCLLKPAESAEQQFHYIEEAMNYVAEDLKIGRLEAGIFAEPSQLRPDGEDAHRVVYESGLLVGDTPQKEVFQTGDGGMATLLFFPVADYDWTQQEKETIALLSKQIFLTLSRMTMTAILRNVMVTDMGVQLPNFSGFMERSQKYLKQGILEQFDAFYFNVRNFKYVNKVFSYAEGDKVMRKYAQLVNSYLHKDEIVARLGGDNYVALIRQENTADFIEKIKQVTIVHQVEQKVKEFVFGATIGGAHLSRIHAPGEIMQRISVAFQVAKRHEGSGVVYYNEDMYQNIMKEKEALNRFYRAFEKKEFVVYFQPKVNLNTREICGAEALVRWINDGKIIPPIEFIPILEKDGSICRLDFYVLEMVCRTLRRWIDEGLQVVRISVNFSRRHLENPDLAQNILEIVNRYGIDHQYIEVELTESEDFRDYVTMSKLVDELKSNGICTSIDDFGTGYSSLNMLKCTNLDLIKIDKSFIPLDQEYPQKKKDMLMFEHIVNIAKDLGMDTIAEGIEKEEQLNYLKSVDCDMVQGYLFDKPLPEEEFTKRLKQRYYS